MLKGSLYDHLDSLLPLLEKREDGKVSCVSLQEVLSGSGVGGMDLLRLEFLCACRVMEDAHTAHHLLPFTPQKFYPQLFQAIILRKFYSALCKRGEKPVSLLSLMELLCHWKLDTFTMRELLPPLPPMLHKPQQLCLRVVEARFARFIQDVLELVPHAYLQRKSEEGDVDSHKCDSIKRLDMSGCHTKYCSSFHPSLLLSYVKKAYHPNRPLTQSSSVLVVDLKLEAEDQEQFNNLGIICAHSRHHGAGLSVKFRRVLISGGRAKTLAYTLSLLADNGVECLELELCDTDDSSVGAVLGMGGTLSALSLAYNHRITSLSFLLQLPHLVELNLSGINLRDKCEGLNGLVCGLKYLCVVGCGLRGADLEVLTHSKHTASLCHLDISENAFGQPLDFYAFCKLCQVLNAIVILEAVGCGFGLVDPTLIGEIVRIFVEKPRLRLLKLNRNDFEPRVLQQHLTQLGRSKSLQCVCLTMPSHVYISGNAMVSARAMEDIVSSFTRSLQAMGATQLVLDWSEEATYSHWFYSV